MNVKQDRIQIDSKKFKKMIKEFGFRTYNEFLETINVDRSSRFLERCVHDGEIPSWFAVIIGDYFNTKLDGFDWFMEGKIYGKKTKRYIQKR